MLGRLIARLLKPYLRELLTVPIEMVHTPLIRDGRPLSAPPSYAHDDDAGIDLTAAERTIIPPGRQALISTATSLAIPPGFVGIIKDRSSFALERIYTHAGVIDAGYRGEIKVLLENRGTEDGFIDPNARIAQLLIVPVAHAELVQVASLDDTKRGAGGFGSTGK